MQKPWFITQPCRLLVINASLRGAKSAIVMRRIARAGCVPRRDIGTILLQQAKGYPWVMRISKRLKLRHDDRYCEDKRLVNHLVMVVTL
jgi:hypothetical protein